VDPIDHQRIPSKRSHPAPTLARSVFCP
jgi:hypothetical protein